MGFLGAQFQQPPLDPIPRVGIVDNTALVSWSITAPASLSSRIASKRSRAEPVVHISLEGHGAAWDRGGPDGSKASPVKAREGRGSSRR